MVGKVWRVLVGIKDGLVLLFLLVFFGLLYAVLSASPYSGSARDGALVLSLAGGIVEQPAEASASDLLGGGSVTREHRLRDIIHALNRAAADEKIRAVALDLDILVGGGQTALTDIGAALDRVRRANKPVLAYATAYSDDSYQLAAHASEVWLNPLGGVVVAGPGGNNLYFGQLLERIGVTANVYRVGAFKSAVEPFTRADMSPEARAAAQALYGSLWQTWLQDVRQARPKAQIVPYTAATVDRIAAANGDMAKAALDAGLIDRIGDRNAFGQRVAQIAGNGDEDVPGDFRAVRLDAYLADNQPSRGGGGIAVVTVAGNIVDGHAGPGTAGAETVVENIERGLRDGGMRALVVRVDSPGGSTIASERIRRAIQSVRDRRIPVVISFGSVAASGGYWIATAGDTIFAEPSTITGSIGVFGILPSFEVAMQRLGVGADGVRTTPLSGQPDLFNGPSPEADRLFQMGVENTYRRFIGLVSQARKLPPQRVHEIAQGRVWDGGTARQLRLVDRFGTLDDALNEAARRANTSVADSGVRWLEQEPGLASSLIRAMAGGDSEAQTGGDVFTQIARRPEAMLVRTIEDARTMMTGSAIQARCLECPAAYVAPPSPQSRTFLARLLGLAGL